MTPYIARPHIFIGLGAGERALEGENVRSVCVRFCSEGEEFGWPVEKESPPKTRMTAAFSEGSYVSWNDF